MSTGGLLLAVAGVWVLCQVLKGQALGRLGIAGDADKPAGTRSSRSGSMPDLPTQDRRKTGLGD